VSAVDDYASDLIALFSRCEADILRELAAGVTSGKAARLNAALTQIRASVKSLRAGSASWADDAVRACYAEGVALAESQVATVLLTMAPVHADAMKALALDLVGRLDGAASTILTQASSTIREVQLEALRLSMSGVKTTPQAARFIRDRLKERGVTGLVDRSGKAWSMTSYADMLARTGGQRAETEGCVNRLFEHGIDLAEVTTHAGACSRCVPWQGRIISLTGSTSGHPTLDEAKASGLLHPNCRHRLVGYIEKEE
jgi:hypothetical protein